MPPKKTSTRATKPAGAIQATRPTIPPISAIVKRKAASANEDEPATKESTASSAVAKKRGSLSYGKPAAKTAAMAKLAAQSRKRKAADDEADEQPAKYAWNAPRNMAPLKKTAASKPIMPKKQAALRKVAVPEPNKEPLTINHPPTQVLDIYVFGEGSAGELGLGAGLLKDVMKVKRPRLNQRLGAKVVGVVHVAVGGMHCAALTHDNKILTWGVNDQDALGRETDEGPMMDIDAAEESDEDEDADSDSDSEGNIAKRRAKAAKQDSGLNGSEAEPREVDPRHFPEGTKFAQLVAGDSTTFALTTTGLVYGWGTFRGNDGIFGFRYRGAKTQPTPILIPELKNITSLAAGANHILALNAKGKVFTWGAGEQNQLARRIVARTATGALVPREFGLGRKKIVNIGCGDYHSYAVDATGATYAWGLNSFAQCGSEPASGDSPTVPTPTVVESLRGFEVQQITGGAHHGIALTTDGKVLVWGRVDNKQGGVDLSILPADSYFKSHNGRVYYLTKPAIVPGLDGVYVATASDTCAAITRDGKAYTWGFNDNYQAGQGEVEDVAIAQLVDNTAVRGKKLVFAGLGGQFGILGGIPVKD